MKSLERFNETKLPKQEEFYSALNKKHNSDKDYQNTIKICENIMI